ncbi:MAG: biotin--[acetyl-CoA-carboxylase] ligase [Pseudomonadota bacterium]
MSQTAELRFFDSVESTNDEARRLIGTVAHPVWCIGAEQTKGVGRRGRNWASPRGNLYASLLYPTDETAEDKSLRSFLAALALQSALALHKTEARITLKWPNDVLVNGAKIAGILLESAPGHLIIGMGVNIMSAPPMSKVEPRAVRPAALSDLGFSLTPKQLITDLSAAFDDWDLKFRQFGFDPIRQAWLTHAARLGETITARLATEEVTGVFDTVDRSGALVLKTPTGIRQITAADIFFEGA